MLSSGSLPMTRAAMPSMIALVAKFASGNEVTASPHPTTPSSVVIFTRHRWRMRVEVVRLRVADRDRLDGRDLGHGSLPWRTCQIRTARRPSAEASAGTSTSSRPGARALWWVAPEAIQPSTASTADPESKRNIPFGTAHRVVPGLDDLARRPGERPARARRRQAQERGGPAPQAEREAGALAVHAGIVVVRLERDGPGRIGPRRVALPAGGDEQEAGLRLGRVALAVEGRARDQPGEMEDDRRGHGRPCTRCSGPAPPGRRRRGTP